jgi:hypothetical protein
MEHKISCHGISGQTEHGFLLDHPENGGLAGFYRNAMDDQFPQFFDDAGDGIFDAYGCPAVRSAITILNGFLHAFPNSRFSSLIMPQDSFPHRHCVAP